MTFKLIMIIIHVLRFWQLAVAVFDIAGDFSGIVWRNFGWSPFMICIKSRLFSVFSLSKWSVEPSFMIKTGVTENVFFIGIYKPVLIRLFGWRHFYTCSQSVFSWRKRIFRKLFCMTVFCRRYTTLKQSVKLFLLWFTHLRRIYATERTGKKRFE